MTEQEYTAAQASGAVQVESPDTDEETSASSTTSDSIAEFIPLLTQLQSVQLCVNAAPTYIPQTFQEQIQFVFDGSNYFLYLYFNNQWNQFPIISGGGGAGVTSVLAGTGISLSGSTGTVTITNTGITSVAAGSGVSVSTTSGAATVTNSGVTSIVAGTGVTVSGATGAVTVTATQSGVTSLTAGLGISLSGSTGAITISGTGSATGVYFGGNGADGALNVSSGTTTIDLGGAASFTKQYSSISITGTGQIKFINPNASGTVIVIKCSGNVTITSSATPNIDASGCGAAGGVGVTVGGNNSSNGTNASDGHSFLYKLGGGAGSATGVGGAIAAAFTLVNFIFEIFGKYPYLFIGGGGGGGSCQTSSLTNGSGGTGGNGGPTLIIECAGLLNFTGSISVAGQNGTASGVGNPSYQLAEGGGGGGGGGLLVLYYNSLTANTGTVNVSGGTGGNNVFGVGGYTVAGGGGGASVGGVGSNGSSSGTSGAKTGGDGAAGAYVIAPNTEFA